MKSILITLIILSSCTRTVPQPESSEKYLEVSGEETSIVYRKRDPESWYYGGNRVDYVKCSEAEGEYKTRCGQ